MFIFEVGALMAAYRRHLPAMAAALDGIDFADAGSVEEAYAKMTPISIDYGIMEQAADVVVIPAEISWSDLGSFEAYHQISPKDSSGNYCEGRTLLLDTRDSPVSYTHLDVYKRQGPP